MTLAENYKSDKTTRDFDKYYHVELKCKTCNCHFYLIEVFNLIFVISNLIQYYQNPCIVILLSFMIIKTGRHTASQEDHDENNFGRILI